MVTGVEAPQVKSVGSNYKGTLDMVLAADIPDSHFESLLTIPNGSRSPMPVYGFLHARYGVPSQGATTNLGVVGEYESDQGHIPVAMAAIDDKLIEFPGNGRPVTKDKIYEVLLRGGRHILEECNADRLAIIVNNIALYVSIGGLFAEHGYDVNLVEAEDKTKRKGFHNTPNPSVSKPAA